MQLLPVATLIFNAVHQDIFACHERQLLIQMLFAHGRIYLHAGCNVYIKVEDTVNGKESLGDTQPSVCRVIQRALEPLARRGEGCILQIAYDKARKRRYALATHGIALIGHRRRAYLL